MTYLILIPFHTEGAIDSHLAYQGDREAKIKCPESLHGIKKSTRDDHVRLAGLSTAAADSRLSN